MARTIKTREQRAGERFTDETAQHVMTIKHDDGLYRHVRFASPESSFYWFELVTWPGHLTVNGDMGTFTFRRVEDMFTFFRTRAGWNHHWINPQYWAEKIQGETKTKAYEESAFRTYVADTAADNEADYPGLRKAVFEQIFANSYGDYYLDDEDSARTALNRFEHEVDGRTFQFTDTWEIDFSEWTIFYLWCCHAIQWGIGQYDAAKAAALVPAAAVAGA